ncbi:hypothetical protein [Streptomyces lydicus]
MTDNDVYGTHTHTTSELARLLTGHLGLAFTEYRCLGSLTGLVHLHHEAW